MLRFTTAVAGVLALVMGIAAHASAAELRVEDLNGRRVDPRAASAGAPATVLLFVSVECPVSNRYAPELRRMYDRLTAQGVRFWLVYPNPLEDATAIRRHVEAFGHPGEPIRDPYQELAKQAGATITPEAAVYDANGRLVYRGRIDDRYVSLGVERPAPTRRDLDLALTSTLAGQRVEVANTQAVGCFIADFAHVH
jgi:hypothetical protein